MNFILALLIEIGSITTSGFISMYSLLDVFTKIADNGYRIDGKIFKELEKKDRVKKEVKKINKIINKLLKIAFFIPGINIITSLINGKITVKKMLNDEEIKSTLVPMSEEEKVFYSHIRGKVKKAMFLAYNSHYEKDTENKELIAFVGNTPIVTVKEEKPSVKDNVCTLTHYQLPYMSYTYEEVKRLASSINGYFKVGNTEGRSIAIIGLKSDEDFNKINIKFQDSQIEYDFEKYDEKIASERKFVVYPFPFEMEDNKELMMCYNAIVKEHEMKEKISNEVISNGLDTQENGPVLKMKY